MNETMGQIIRRLRKERNLTQEELAEQLNITYQAVSRWENGTGMPDISQIVPLSNLFGVTTDVLFGIHDTDLVVDKEKIMDEYDQIDNPTVSYEFIMKVLKQYPGHTDFLQYALSDGTQIVVRKLADDLSKIIAECERIARILFNCSNDTDSIAIAHKCMATIYSSLGQYDHAKEHTDALPDSIMLRSKETRECHFLTGNYKETMLHDSSMFFRLLRHELMWVIVELGKDYYQEKQYENASICFNALLDMVRGLFGSLPAYLALEDPIIWLARTYLKLNQYEKALDTLEILAIFSEQQKQIVVGNEISDHPLLRPAEYKYMSGYNTDAVRRECLDYLGQKIFDPIRENTRFIKTLRKLEK